MSTKHISVSIVPLGAIFFGELIVKVFKTGEIVIGKTGLKFDVDSNGKPKNRPLAILRKWNDFYFVCFGTSNKNKGRFQIKNGNKTLYFNETTSLWIVAEYIRNVILDDFNSINKLKKRVDKLKNINTSINDIDTIIFNTPPNLSLKDRKKIIKQQFKTK